ncbi:MAG: restriction endonuclease, partial [Ramlibacter sp.]|nr:restriction endonuclease [Ramlibacter sp.]
VAETGGSGPDGGIDLVLRKGSETFLVQCKQWKAFKVGVDVVRELYGVMAARGAAGGFVVTSGAFTEEASAFAQGRNVKLVAGSQLQGLLEQAKGSLPPKPSSPQAPVRPAEARSHTGVEPTPQCPACNAAMVRRTARKGAASGSQFWGCSKFPACRGTR